MRRIETSVACAVVLLLATASAASATDDYTLPYYDPGVTLSYGVDRDPRVGVQLDYTGKTWWDASPHWGRVYDNHTGLDFPMALRSPVAAAKDGVVVDVEGGYGTQQFGSFGNFVRIRHADGRQTLYYHLASAADGGIGVSLGQSIIAGRTVGRSGCSGMCYGAHLHFELLVEQGKDLVVSDAMAHHLWTTWPGRVPFLASYVRESNAGTEVIKRGRTITHWVEFRNDGGRTWKPTGSPGRTVLATFKPPAHASKFVASDWTYNWLATVVDQAAVPPGYVGRFTFGLRGSPAEGSYVETFDLLTHGTWWFDHQRLGSYYVPILVTSLDK
jgi:murein DD-endopeptidase MepM/ murein hydrolase activator NlpD